MPAAEFHVSQPSPARAQTSLGRRLAAAGIIAAGFAFVTMVAAATFTDQTASGGDFIEYWAAARQVTHHANPYDARVILALEQNAGFRDSSPRVSFSPPVALGLAAPIGYLSPAAGFVLWTMLELGCLAVSSWLLWRLFGRPNSRLHLLLFAFAPILACECCGQLGIFLLFSLVLFLTFHRGRPVLAGAALFLFALKPHLLMPLALVFVLWSVRERTFRILAGFAAALAASCALSLYFDNHAWSHYAGMMAANSAALGKSFIPTLSVLVRFTLFPTLPWIAYVPELCACSWAAWFYWNRRNRWSWIDDGLLVLLVAAVCAPYAWFMDESILFPAVLLGMYRVAESKRSLLPIFAVGGVAAIEYLAVLSTNGWYFLWTTPAWLAWYLYATRHGRPVLAPAAG